MGRLVDGTWVSEQKWSATDGRFKRTQSVFRSWITADGAPGPTGEGGFPAAAGRYHLYVAMACPWANRTLIVRRLKKLDDIISVSAVHPDADDDGWKFTPDLPDHLFGSALLSEIYVRGRPDATTRATVPVLWDKERDTIVSNESSEIIRMFNSAFDAVGGDRSIDLYPVELRDEIDAINAVVYETVNNGVYKCGFAGTQEAYEEAVTAVFETLDMLEERLGRQRYIAGNRITEADWRLFTSLVRFDIVYATHFKCNIRRIADYRNLSNYLRELYQWPGVAETVDIAAIKRHYYGSHRSLNPKGIIPLGPDQDLNAPHDRGAMTVAA